MSRAFLNAESRKGNAELRRVFLSAFVTNKVIINE